jgi:hypothetical protein
MIGRSVFGLLPGVVVKSVTTKTPRYAASPNAASRRRRRERPDTEAGANPGADAAPGSRADPAADTARSLTAGSDAQPVEDGGHSVSTRPSTGTAELKEIGARFAEPTRALLGPSGMLRDPVLGGPSYV